ncbi:F0F1 ATP synthase subunit A [Hymenobacter sp. BT683]|uniref:ATP synthase subunit a n=1 Tax=Hymenobacter jeongseonensis TaxID=2791027 RepID=A0ABS0ID58_9BACT|nr:F0F1 ATP synthase subunit A [Hymenobacter jeongseonensis]MBF9236097.1 F0F1 ATP synthase subunit A [Hymenobacter jeongseonensis]
MKRLLSILLCFVSLSVFANEPAAEASKGEGFNPGEMILEHIGDSHEWHLATLGEGEHATHVSVPLPIIAYQPTKGLSMFSGGQLAHGHSHNGLKLEHDKLVAEDGSKVYDFSITKNTASLLFSAALMLFVFTAVARGYKKNHGRAPSGLQSFFEPVIIFIRDEIAKKNIGPKYERYMPYLLTAFFFIWFNNLLGLMPGAANLSGNIAVTMVLAVLTLIITLASSNKNYWAHIFATPGVPKPLLPIMIVVEFLGIFTKPFSLMIRLFANITAGHIVVLSFISLVFIFKSWAVAPVTLAFGLFINILELLVAILQAFIFTLLTSMYIGGAVEEHHDADFQIGGGDGADQAHVPAH